MYSKTCRIKHFPVSFFSTILGLSGITIAFQKSEQILKLPGNTSFYLLIITLISFGIISLTYLLKTIFFPLNVKKEFEHPVKLNFFPTFSISLLLLSIAFLGISTITSKYFWISGTIIHLILSLKIISIWIKQEKFEIKHMNPSWFIPAVGNILVPIAGITHFSPEISWFFFSIGLMFWMILLVIFFNRIFFHKFLSEKLVPTLFILIAPPAAGFISYTKLTGEVTEFGKIIYYFALFLVILLATKFKTFFKIKFYLSWWAYLFPLSSITTASILMFHETEIPQFKYISLFLLGVSSVMLILLTIKTTKAISKNHICIEEK